jgi:hypothetical protein
LHAAVDNIDEVDLAVGLEQIQAVVDRVLYQSDRVDPGAEYALEGDDGCNDLGAGAAARGSAMIAASAPTRECFRGNLDLI